MQLGTKKWAAEITPNEKVVLEVVFNNEIPGYKDPPPSPESVNNMRYSVFKKLALAILSMEPL